VPQLLAVIERILSLDPDHPEAVEWTAWSYMSMGQPEKALGMLERHAAAHPERFRLVSWLEQCYDMLGRPEEARRILQSGLERLIEYVRQHPDDVYARSLLATRLVRSGSIDAGTQQVERILEIAPHDGRIRYNAACTFARAGMTERAIEELKAGIREIPSYLSDWPRRDPDLESLHGHPEFIRLFGKPDEAPRA